MAVVSNPFDATYFNNYPCCHFSFSPTKSQIVLLKIRFEKLKLTLGRSLQQIQLSFEQPQ